MSLCFSPVGDGLWSRARRFPALVNCTTIDWQLGDAMGGPKLLGWLFRKGVLLMVDLWFSEMGRVEILNPVRCFRDF
jgi:hypothetical protein